MIPCSECGWYCFSQDLQYGMCPSCREPVVQVDDDPYQSEHDCRIDWAAIGNGDNVMCDRAERLAEAIKNAPLPCPVDECTGMVTVRYVQVNIPMDPDEWEMEIEGECLENPDERHKAEYFCLGGSDSADEWLAEWYMERAMMVRECLDALDQS